MGRGGGGGEGGGGRAALPDAHPALAAGSCGQPISIAFVLAFAAPYGPAPRSLCGACALQRLLPPCWYSSVARPLRQQLSHSRCFFAFTSNPPSFSSRGRIVFGFLAFLYPLLSFTLFFFFSNFPSSRHSCCRFDLECSAPLCGQLKNCIQRRGFLVELLSSSFCAF